MNIPNYINYGFVVYNQSTNGKHLFELGDVVINSENEIGVIIQLHDDGDYRTDMFGNCCDDEIRLATDKEISIFRQNILSEGTFNH